MQRLAVALTILVLAGCAQGAATIAPSQPHGIIMVDFAGGADATVPVAIVALDGVNLPGSRTYFPVAPGEHEVIVTALGIREPTLVTAVRDLERATGIPNRRGLVLDVEAGVRYTIAAHVHGPTRADWTPVLVKMEVINP